MDIKIYEYIENKYNTQSMQPVFVSDNKFNILNTLFKKLNTDIYYNNSDLDNPSDCTHHYIKRNYKGDIHDNDSCTKFTKHIRVRVNTDDTIKYGDNDVCIFVEELCVPKVRKESTKYKDLYRKVNTVINKFIQGEIDPCNLEDIENYSVRINLEYDIGVADIYRDNTKYVAYDVFYIAIPYKSKAYKR